MPTIDVAMARSLNTDSTLQILAAGIKRSIVSDASTTVTNVKTALSSWDNCMSVTWCKWPVIGAIVVAALIAISIVWCLARCICCGLSCCCECCYCLKCCGNCLGCCSAPGSKRKNKYLDDPYIPPNHNENMGYQMQPPMKAPNNNTYNIAPSAVSTSSVHPASGPPQYAEFDVSRKGGEDALPAMPSWDSGETKKVSLEIQESVEMNNLAKPPTTPNLGSVAAAGAAGGAFAARQNNAAAAYGGRSMTPGARSMTPGAMSQGRSTPGMGPGPGGRSTPGFGNQGPNRNGPGFAPPPNNFNGQGMNNQGMNGQGMNGQGMNDRGMNGAPQQNGFNNLGMNAPNNYNNQASYDPYANTPYASQDPYDNAAGYGQQAGVYNAVDNGYSNNAGFQTTQATGYQQPQTAAYGNGYDTGYETGYGQQNALPSPQESAFHYDNPAYHSATGQSAASNTYNAVPQQRSMTGGYNSAPQQAVNNPYSPQTEVYEMPSPDYGTTMNAQAPFTQPQPPRTQSPATFAPQQGGYNGGNGNVNTVGIQNNAGFDFNSEFSRPGTSSGPMRQDSTPSSLAAPRPYRPNPTWTGQ